MKEIEWYRKDEVLIFSGARFERYIHEMPEGEKIIIEKGVKHYTIYYLLITEESVEENIVHTTDTLEEAKEWVERNIDEIRVMASGR